MTIDYQSLFEDLLVRLEAIDDFLFKICRERLELSLDAPIIRKAENDALNKLSFMVEDALTQAFLACQEEERLDILCRQRPPAPQREKSV